MTARDLRGPRGGVGAPGCGMEAVLGLRKHQQIPTPF